MEKAACGSDEPSVSEESKPMPTATAGPSSPQKKKKSKDTFRYGNYNRYYAKRLGGHENSDERLQLFKKEWFEHKTVLDIGCNIGVVTLSIARDFRPRRILGIDIDAHLVGVARKNIRHYCDDSVQLDGKYPAQLVKTGDDERAPPKGRQPLLGTPFPGNVWFRQENFVLDADELVETVEEEYDVVLALSISKWIQLNWGDAGLKRFFRRAFAALRPGGRFIFEVQPLESYRKRAVTPDMKTHLREIQLRPDGFERFLLEEVGFVTVEHLGVSRSAVSKGFSRPIAVYVKRQPDFVDRFGPRPNVLQDKLGVVNGQPRTGPSAKRARRTVFADEEEEEED